MGWKLKNVLVSQGNESAVYGISAPILRTS